MRGAAGGMLIGVPLLYTMEVWWIGSSTAPARMAAVLLFSFVPVFFLMRISGFRESEDSRAVDAVIDSVDAVALGIVCVTLILVLLREVTLSTPPAEVVGKVVYEAVPFSIGVALASNFLRRSRGAGDGDGDGGGGGDGESGSDRRGQPTQAGGLQSTVADIGATVIGAVFVAFNIAPTDEIPMLAAASSPASLLAIVLASLVISYGIVFEAGFSSQEKRRQQLGVLQRPLTETAVCYLVSLLAAAFMLWLFQNLDLTSPRTMALEHVVLLGLPACVGGAAGRLAV